MPPPPAAEWVDNSATANKAASSTGGSLSSKDEEYKKIFFETHSMASGAAHSLCETSRLRIAGKESDRSSGRSRSRRAIAIVALALQPCGFSISFLVKTWKCRSPAEQVLRYREAPAGAKHSSSFPRLATTLECSQLGRRRVYKNQLHGASRFQRGILAAAPISPPHRNCEAATRFCLRRFGLLATRPRGCPALLSNGLPAQGRMTYNNRASGHRW